MPRSEPIASVKWQVLRRTDWTDSYNFLIYLLLSLHLSLPRCHVAAAAASFRVLADNRGRSRHPVWPKCPVRRTLESDRICKSWQSKHSSDSGWWWITMDPIFCESNLIGAFLIASPGPKVEAWFDRISLDVDPLDEAPEREHTHRCRAQMESLAGISRNIKESSWEITWNQFDHFWTFENLGWSWFWSILAPRHLPSLPVWPAVRRWHSWIWRRCEWLRRPCKFQVHLHVLENPWKRKWSFDRHSYHSIHNPF